MLLSDLSSYQLSGPDAASSNLHFPAATRLEREFVLDACDKSRTVAEHTKAVKDLGHPIV